MPKASRQRRTTAHAMMAGDSGEHLPRPETDEIAPHLAFFQRLVAMLQKRLADESNGDNRHRRRGPAGHRRRR